MHQTDDHRIRTHFRQGCPAAFEALWRRHHEAVRQTVAGMSGGALDAADIDDITQEAWIRAWRGRQGYDPARPFLPWLRTIGRNVLRNRYRRRRPTDRAIGEARREWQGEPPGAPDEVMERAELAEGVEAALQDLTELRRSALRSSLGLEEEGGGQSSEKVPDGVCRKRLHDARRAVEKTLHERGLL